MVGFIGSENVLPESMQQLRHKILGLLSLGIISVGVISF